MTSSWPNSNQYTKISSVSSASLGINNNKPLLKIRLINKINITYCYFFSTNCERKTTIQKNLKLSINRPIFVECLSSNFEQRKH